MTSPTDSTDGLFRLLSVNVRRYSHDPSTRVAAARNILTAAVALYAGETSADGAASASCEAVAQLVQAERARARRSA